MSKENLEETIRNIMNKSLNEGSGRAGSKIFTDVKDAIDDMIDMMSPTSKGELVPYQAPGVPTSKGAPKGDFDIKKPETKTDVKTDVKPDVKTDVKTDVKPEVKKDVKPEVKKDVKPEVKKDVKPEVKKDVKPEVKKDVTQKRVPESPKRPRKFRIPKNFPTGSTPGQHLNINQSSYVPVKTYLHMAKEYMEQTEYERTEIENVPRPNSNRIKNMTRNQEIKKKIIDETARRKKTIKDAINLKPETNDHEVNEINEGRGTKRALAGLGAGLVAGQDITKAANEKIAGMLGTKPMDRDLSSGEAWTDVGLDVASMIPVVGAVPSAINAYRRFKRGDYADALVDVAGMIPGVKWFTNPMKYGGKLVKGASLGSKIAGPKGVVGLGARVGSEVAGGKQIPTSGVLAGTKTGKKIDKVVDTAEKNITSPANMAQLGTTVDAVQQQITGKQIKDQLPSMTSSANASERPVQQTVNTSGKGDLENKKKKNSTVTTLSLK